MPLFTSSDVLPHKKWRDLLKMWRDLLKIWRDLLLNNSFIGLPQEHGSVMKKINMSPAQVSKRWWLLHLKRWVLHYKSTPDWAAKDAANGDHGHAHEARRGADQGGQVRVRCCLLCIYMPAIDRSLSDCRYNWQAFGGGDGAGPGISKGSVFNGRTLISYSRIPISYWGILISYWKMLILE